MKYLYIDTEFTELTTDAKLISIALVHCEDDFYAELSDGWTTEICSGFVQANVLPYLFGPKQQMSTAECSDALFKWIDSKGDCVLVSGNPHWDMPHVQKLLPVWPAGLSKQAIGVCIPSAEMNAYFEMNGLPRHNALNDAYMLQHLSTK